MGEIIAIGAHVKSEGEAYVRHGIYIGNYKIIHYSVLADGMKIGPIKEVSLLEFHGGKGYSVQAHANAIYKGSIAVNRARGRLGEDSYDALDNNCEHFVNWVIDGNHKSQQVDKGVAIPSRIASVRDAGMTSGFVTVGGGVRAETLSVAAAPVAIATAMGYIIYKMLNS